MKYQNDKVYTDRVILVRRKIISGKDSGFCRNIRCCFKAPAAIVQYRIDDVARYNYLWQDKVALEYRCAGLDYQKVYGNCDILPDERP